MRKNANKKGLLTGLRIIKKIIGLFMCAALITTLGLSATSCGSKKAKMHIQKNIESSLAQVSSKQSAQQNIQQNENNSEQPETTRKTGDVTVITMHTYEFFDYSGEKGKYNSSSKAFLEKYHYSYGKNNISSFNDIKNYILKNYKAAQEPTFECKLQKDGSAKYIYNGKDELKSGAIVDFFKNNRYIKSIRYFNKSGDDYLYFDYFVPSFLGDLDYLLIMSVVYCPSLNKNRLGGENVESVEEIGGGWYYQVQRNNAVKVQIVY